MAENGDTEESREADMCVLHFKESAHEHFTFIAKVKDPEALWINLLKIRDDRRSNLLDLHIGWTVDSIFDQIPESLSQFCSYHRDCYKHFTSNLSRLILRQGSTSEDAPSARQSSCDSATKDCSIFKPDCIFCNSEGRKKVNKGIMISLEGLSRFENRRNHVLC